MSHYPKEADTDKSGTKPGESGSGPIGLKIYVPEKMQRLVLYGIMAVVGVGSGVTTYSLNAGKAHSPVAAQDGCQCGTTIEPKLKELEADVRRLSDSVSKMQGTMEAFMAMQGNRRTSIDAPGGYNTIATLQTNLDRPAQ